MRKVLVLSMVAVAIIGVFIFKGRGDGTMDTSGEDMQTQQAVREQTSPILLDMYVDT